MPGTIQDSNGDRVKVFAIEQEPVAAAGLRAICETDPTLVFVGHGPCSENTFHCLNDLDPDVIFVDLLQLESHCLNRLREMNERGFTCIVWSQVEARWFSELAFENGASACISRFADEGAIARVIHQALSMPVQRLVGHRKQKLPWGLSERQFEAFILMGKGLNTKQIALKMGVSHRTIETFWAKIKTKMGIRCINELGPAVAIRILREYLRLPALNV